METKDRGALLEDMVASIFRGWGFNTETRITLTDEGSTAHRYQPYNNSKVLQK